MYLALAEYKTDGAAVVPVLIRALDDKSSVVRSDAAAALGRLKRSAAPAREALLRESRHVDKEDYFCTGRTLAGWALTQLTR